MNAATIEFVIRHRTLVLVGVFITFVLSAWAIRHASLDAIPDISDPQIVIYAKWPRSAQQLEAQISRPIARSLAGISGIRAVRATSHMGYAFIYLILDRESSHDSVQKAISDRLAALRMQLPADAVVSQGPNASSMGWIYQYALVSTDGLHDLRELRLLHEQRIKPALQGVSGVAEVASVGGLEKQYQFRIFPPLLAESGLSLPQVVTALRGFAPETGGRTLEVANRDYQVRGGVDAHGADQIEMTVLGHRADGQPIHPRDIGYLMTGTDQRRGVAELNGAGEAVGGIVIMEHNRNVLDVTQAIERRLGDIKAELPPGVEIITTYDRATLVRETLRHFLLTLLYELAVVIAVMLLFLRNIRAATAPVSILLLGLAFTAIPLAGLDQTVNLLSLAGLFVAIGVMADAAIVVVENCAAELAARHRSDERLDAAERQRIVIRAVANVSRPLLFSMLIILASFLPVFFLTEKETRLFDALAYSKTFAMAFSTLLTIFLLPILVRWIFSEPAAARPARPGEGPLMRGYRRALGQVLRHRHLFLGASLAATIGALMMLAQFKTEFMPRMEEGALLYMPTTLPGVPVREAGWLLQQMDKKLAAFPEVASVFGKLGRADTATDPAPVSMIETTLRLKPESEWRAGMTREKLVAEMDAAMKFIGYANNWAQPISARVAMQDTGIPTTVGIKLRGSDPATLDALGQSVESLLRRFAGTRSVIAERLSSGYFIDATLDPAQLARHNVDAEAALATVRYAIGGDNATLVKDRDGALIPLGIQYAPEYIDTLDKIRAATVVPAIGKPVALGELGAVTIRKLPEMLRNDNGALASYVYIDIGAANAAAYVRDAQRFLAANLALPAGYSLEWAGDYQNVARSQAKLLWVVPAALAAIFLLLLVAFRSLADTLLILLSAPFALVGAVALQAALDYPLTTAIIVGYIALFAIAIQTGIIMIVFIRQALARKHATASYMDAVIAGSVTRLRPKLMTVACAALSLLPIMLLDGPGIEIMRPIATPIVGGMISSSLYVLFLIPCLFKVGEDIQGWLRKPPGEIRSEHR